MLLIYITENNCQFACKKEIGSKDRARIALLSSKGILPTFPTLIPMLGCFFPVLIFALLFRSTKTEMSRIQIWQHMINFNPFATPAEFKRKINGRLTWMRFWFSSISTLQSTTWKLQPPSCLMTAFPNSVAPTSAKSLGLTQSPDVCTGMRSIDPNLPTSMVKLRLHPEEGNISWERSKRNTKGTLGRCNRDFSIFGKLGHCNTIQATNLNNKNLRSTEIEVDATATKKSSDPEFVMVFKVANKMDSERNWRTSLNLRPFDGSAHLEEQGRFAFNFLAYESDQSVKALSLLRISVNEGISLWVATPVEVNTTVLGQRLPFHIFQLEDIPKGRISEKYLWDRDVIPNEWRRNPIQRNWATVLTSERDNICSSLKVPKHVFWHCRQKTNFRDAPPQLERLGKYVNNNFQRVSFVMKGKNNVKKIIIRNLRFNFGSDSTRSG